MLSHHKRHGHLEHRHRQCVGMGYSGVAVSLTFRPRGGVSVAPADTGPWNGDSVPQMREALRSELAIDLTRVEADTPSLEGGEASDLANRSAANSNDTSTD